ncbi:MAG: hypothetical protein Q9184_004241 [Pyrenodesmia sp. 2 TL-2023]
MFTSSLNAFYLLFSLCFTSLLHASPVTSPSVSQPPAVSPTTLLLASPRPPKAPICPSTLSPRPGWSRFFGRDCQDAVAKIPRDTRPASPLRNFYLVNEHVDPAMPNVQLPLEVESGQCVVQILIASSFLDVPHEKATWMDIWGPARHILQRCVTPSNTGGIVTHIGQEQKLDLVIFSKRSIFAASRRLRNSPDPAAADIATIEFMQLLGIVPAHVGTLDAPNANGTDVGTAASREEEGTATA